MLTALSQYPFILGVCSCGCMYIFVVHVFICFLRCFPELTTTLCIAMCWPRSQALSSCTYCHAYLFVVESRKHDSCHFKRLKSISVFVYRGRESENMVNIVSSEVLSIVRMRGCMSCAFSLLVHVNPVHSMVKPLCDLCAFVNQTFTSSHSVLHCVNICYYILFSSFHMYILCSSSPVNQA